MKLTTLVWTTARNRSGCCCGRSSDRPEQRLVPSAAEARVAAAGACLPCRVDGLVRGSRSEFRRRPGQRRHKRCCGRAGQHRSRDCLDEQRGQPRGGPRLPGRPRGKPCPQCRLELAVLALPPALARRSGSGTAGGQQRGPGAAHVPVEPPGRSSPRPLRRVVRLRYRPVRVNCPAQFRQRQPLTRARRFSPAPGGCPGSPGAGPCQ